MTASGEPRARQPERGGTLAEIKLRRAWTRPSATRLPPVAAAGRALPHAERSESRDEGIWRTGPWVLAAVLCGDRTDVHEELSTSSQKES